MTLTAQWRSFVRSASCYRNYPDGRPYGHKFSDAALLRCPGQLAVALSRALLSLQSDSCCATLRRAHAGNGLRIDRARYRVKNGGEYDQALQKHGSLTVWFTPETVAAWPLPTGQRGWHAGIPTGRSRPVTCCASSRVTLATDRRSAALPGHAARHGYQGP
jgi:hypothetical protein